MARNNCRATSVYVGGRKFNLKGAYPDVVYMFDSQNDKWLRVTHRDQIKELSNTLGHPVALMASTLADLGADLSASDSEHLSKLFNGVFNSKTTALSFTKGKGASTSDAVSNRFDKLFSSSNLPFQVSSALESELSNAALEYVASRSGLKAKGLSVSDVPEHLRDRFSKVLDRSFADPSDVKLDPRECLAAFTEFLRRGLDSDSNFPNFEDYIFELGAFSTHAQSSLSAPSVSNVFPSSSDTQSLQALFATMSDEEFYNYVYKRAYPGEFAQRQQMRTHDRQSFSDLVRLHEEGFFFDIDALLLQSGLPLPSPDPVPSLELFDSLGYLGDSDPVVEQIFAYNSLHYSNTGDLEFHFNPRFNILDGPGVDTVSKVVGEIAENPDASVQALSTVLNMRSMISNLNDVDSVIFTHSMGRAANSLLEKVFDTGSSHYDESLSVSQRQDVLLNVVYPALERLAVLKDAKPVLHWTAPLLEHVEAFSQSPEVLGDIETKVRSVSVSNALKEVKVLLSPDSDVLRVSSVSSQPSRSKDLDYSSWEDSARRTIAHVAVEYEHAGFIPSHNASFSSPNGSINSYTATAVSHNLLESTGVSPFSGSQQDPLIRKAYNTAVSALNEGGLDPFSDETDKYVSEFVQSALGKATAAAASTLSGTLFDVSDKVSN